MLFVQLTDYSKWRITQCCAEDITKRTNPRAYGKNIIVRKPKERELVTLDSYREHFRIMSISTGPPDVIDNETYTVFDPKLDRAITIEEVEKGIRHLKKEKSPGEDCILSEFIDYDKEDFKQILANLLNKLYVNGYFYKKMVHMCNCAYIQER